LTVALCSLAGCAGTGGAKAQPPEVREAGAEQLIGTEWVLESILIDGRDGGFTRKELEDLDMADAYTLSFGQDRISGKGAPNRYHSPCQTGEGRALRIAPVASTLMASFREPAGLKEGDYFQYLAGVSRWDLEDGRLCLSAQIEPGTVTRLYYRRAAPEAGE
jgi:heat shock protein HslJ